MTPLELSRSVVLFLFLFYCVLSVSGRMRMQPSKAGEGDSADLLMCFVF